MRREGRNDVMERKDGKEMMGWRSMRNYNHPFGGKLEVGGRGKPTALNKYERGGGNRPHIKDERGEGWGRHGYM